MIDIGPFNLGLFLNRYSCISHLDCLDYSNQMLITAFSQFQQFDGIPNQCDINQSSYPSWLNTRNHQMRLSTGGTLTLLISRMLGKGLV
ncbi:hypothetical protein LINGRAHAP2_LOCUS5191 [Linum grandiflorum]